MVELHSIHTQSNSSPYRTNFLLTHSWSAPIIRFSLCIYTHPPKKKRERVYLTHRFCTRSKQTRHTHTHTRVIWKSLQLTRRSFTLFLSYIDRQPNSRPSSIYLYLYIYHTAQNSGKYTIYLYPASRRRHFVYKIHCTMPNSRPSLVLYSCKHTRDETHTVYNTRTRRARAHHIRCEPEQRGKTNARAASRLPSRQQARLRERGREWARARGSIESN